MLARAAGRAPRGHAVWRHPAQSRLQQGLLAARIAFILLLACGGALPRFTAIAQQPAAVGTPTAPSLSASRPVCGARPWRPVEMVTILRQPLTEDPAVRDLTGEPLPPAERVTMGSVVAAWSACLASGNVAGLLGLFTEDGVRRLLADRTPFVSGPAGLRVSILAVSDVVRLGDGRVGARILLDPSGVGTAPPETLNIIIERQDGDVWRIDHLRQTGEAETASGDPMAPRALLRRPIAPGSGVPLRPPGAAIPMRGVDMGRTGIAPGPAPAGAPEELWQTPTGWHTEAQPVVARGLIYFGGFSLGERTPQLSAIDEETGRVRWQTTAPVAWAEFPDAPALAGEMLFAPVQAPVAGVMAVAAATGDPLWFAPFGFTTMSAPAVDANAVYISGWGVRNPRDRVANDTVGMVVALDQRSGRELWRYVAPARFDAVSAGASLVYVPSERGLFAVDRRTGAKRWQARFSPGVGESAVVAGDLVVFPGWEITSGVRGIFAVDAATGALKWRRELRADPTSRAGGAAFEGTVFISAWEAPADDSGRGVPTLSALDLASGDVRWHVAATGPANFDSVGAGSVTPPVIVENSVVFGVAVRSPAPEAEDASGLYAVDTSTGQSLWHVGTEPIRSAPSVLDGAVYVMGGLRARGGATGGNLFAFGAG